MWRATVLTLFPDMFPGPLGLSLAGAALGTVWSLQTKDIRDHGIGRHRAVDDTPAGGGPGMVLRADVVAAAFDAAVARDDGRPRILMSPRGKPLTQARVRDLAAGEGVIVLCGRFEGFDERIVQGRDFEEISVGDYVLSGGETAALVLLDACVRLLPGVMGHAQSGIDESFSDGLLEHPHYTRPRTWEGRAIPDILLSGDHARIAAWRRAQSLALTRARRPELLGSGGGAQGARNTALPSAVNAGNGKGEPVKTLDFWYDFASTYSYPAAMRVEDVAREKGVTVRWQPFLLGPIFARQGWTTSPFNLFAAKGKNMFRDLARICEKAGLPFARPDPFPQNSLLAARVACTLEDGARGAFTRAVYTLEFAEGRRIDSTDTMEAALRACGLDPHAVLERASSDANKARLKAVGAQAEALDIYGAPSFVTAGGELFWGNDRLEEAVDWAASGR